MFILLINDALLIIILGLGYSLILGILGIFFPNNQILLKIADYGKDTLLIGSTAYVKEKFLSNQKQSNQDTEE